MTPIPPSSSDGSPLPPRHRPSLGNLVKETTEQDLWDFDDVELPGESQTASELSIPALPAIPDPKPQDKLRVNQIKSTPPMKTSGKKERFQIPQSKPAPKTSGGGSTTIAPKPSDDFADLDHWDVAGEIPDLPEPLDEMAPEPETPPEAAPAAIEAAVPIEVPEPIPAPAAVATPAETPPAPLNLKLGLTKIERVGLIALMAVLLLGGIGVVIFSLKRIPTESALGKSNEFPVKGKILSISSAVSYWRAPMIEGKKIDVVRRGTVLIPAVSLATAEGSGGMRVIFRNSDGESVGDIVTRAVQPGENLEITATAGFDDIGMHAAYRTGETKPWKIEIYEAPTAESTNTAFTKFFEMNISTDRR